MKKITCQPPLHYVNIHTGIQRVLEEVVKNDPNQHTKILNSFPLLTQKEHSLGIAITSTYAKISFDMQ